MKPSSTERYGQSAQTRLHDPHNHTSLAQLLEHIRHQRDQQCSTIHAEAEREAERLVRDARTRAAGLLRRARQRERGAEAERLRSARAGQRGRIREVWLNRRRSLAQRGLEVMKEELARLWRDSAEARRCWLLRSLGDARRVLPGEHWRLEHPQDWDAEALAKAVDQACPGVTIEPVAMAGLEAGFRVLCGRASIDTSPDGLLARRDRIAGRLLARQSTRPPELAS